MARARGLGRSTAVGALLAACCTPALATGVALAPSRGGLSQIVLLSVAIFLGWLAGAVYAFALSDGLEAMGSMWPMQIVIGAACLFFIWYAWTMSKTGVLR